MIYFITNKKDNTMEGLNVLDQIQRITSEGGKIFIKNRKGVELDITVEMRMMIMDIVNVEKTYLEALSKKEDKRNASRAHIIKNGFEMNQAL